MTNIKDDFYYLKRIKQDTSFIVSHMKDITIEELNTNEVLLDSMMFRMIQISENAKKLTDEYKKNHPQISWNELNGMRNRVVHDYGSVDLNIVFMTLKQDIPDLLEQIDNL
ncbi:MAG: DUF86 domain-containing protein [Erysipelotrichaceae bacterium]|nr:DUF86 domain-containing protein [Erysipelotrichaceae bacterium]